ncbi:unnamed protein product [Caenorhabditis brenneri]
MKPKKSKTAFESNAQRARHAKKRKREGNNNSRQESDDEKVEESEEVGGSSSRKRVIVEEDEVDDDDEISKKSRKTFSQNFDDFHDPIGFSSDIRDTVDVIQNPESLETIDFIREERDRIRMELEVFSDEFHSNREKIIMTSNRLEEVENQRIIIIRRISIVRASREKYRRKYNDLNKRLRKNLMTKNKDDPESLSNHRLFPIQYSSLKNNSSKKLRFNETLKNIQFVSQETDIKSYIIDFLKFLEKEPDQSFRNKLTLLESCILKNKANLSRHQLDKIKKYTIKFLGHDYLPQVKAVCSLAHEKSMIELFEVKQVPRNDSTLTTVVHCVDVKKLLKWRLEKLSSSNQLIFDSYSGEEIVIAIGGDCGGGSTKINMIIGNVRQPNSITHISTLAVFDDSDDHENIRKYLQPLLNQLNALESIEYSENGKDVSRKIHQKFVADFKLVGESLGHRKQSSKDFCTYCEETNPRGDQQKTLKDLDLTKRAVLRSMDSYKKHAMTGEKSVIIGSKPLFEKIALFDYLIPMLHCLTGVFVKYIYWNLWKCCVEEDNCTRFQIFPSREKTEKSADDDLSLLKQKFQQEKNKKLKEKLKKELEKCMDERQELDSPEESSIASDMQ